MPTAILIDGAFFIKRFRAIEPQNAHDARRAAECAHRWACAHLSPRPNGSGADAPQDRQRRRQDRRELYRIFFYDCPPLTKKMHNPISKRIVDFAKSAEAALRLQLHEHLRGMRKVPAAKQARREGIDFILDPMWQRIPPNLNEHIDGLRSTCPRHTCGKSGDNARQP